MLNARTHLGGEYTWGAFRYPNRFGHVRNQTAMITGRLQLSSTTVLLWAAGVGKMNSEYVGAVPIDPALAAILGADVFLQVTQARFLTPSYRFQYIQRLQRGSFFGSADRSFNAGNGVLMAGVRDTGSLGYTRILNSRIGLTWIASSQRFSGRVGTLATTLTSQGAVNMSVRIAGSVSFTTQGGFRYTSVTTAPRRREVFAGIGLAWTPGGDPFSF